MHHLDLIFILTAGFIGALVLGLVTQRLGLSPIVGYILAGVVIGPHTPGFEADKELAAQLSEIGVILLMFGVGLQFHFKELLAVKRVAIPGALVQSLAATVAGAMIMRFFGWSWPAGIVFGLALSVASTVVLTRVLADNNHLHTPTGHIAIGWLVMEDLLTVFVLVLLPAIFGPDTAASGGSATFAIGLATLKIVALVVFVFVVGGWVIPRLLTHIAATGSRELFTLGVLAIAMGIAVGSAAVFGVSMALGAFLAGMVVARSDFSLRAATDAMPMRDAFAVLFFVGVGMLFDFHSLVESPWLILATLGVVLIGKPAAALVFVVLLRYPLRVALSVAVALAQIGEFSFILATMGRQLAILPEQATDILVAAAVVSITLNPLLYRAVRPVESWVSRRRWLWRWLNVHDSDVSDRPARSASRRAIVVGFGPVGQTVMRLMQDNAIEPVIVELNLETVQDLRLAGIAAVYGDASRPETLRQAGIAHADILILSASSIESDLEVVRVARELCPRIRVLARTTYLREAPSLRLAGADGVFTGEGEVALAMTEFILGQFNATREQIDRERERIREDLFDKALDEPPWEKETAGAGESQTGST